MDRTIFPCQIIILFFLRKLGDVCVVTQECDDATIYYMIHCIYKMSILYETELFPNISHNTDYKSDIAKKLGKKTSGSCQFMGWSGKK